MRRNIGRFDCCSGSQNRSLIRASPFSREEVFPPNTPPCLLLPQNVTFLKNPGAAEAARAESPLHCFRSEDSFTEKCKGVTPSFLIFGPPFLVCVSGRQIGDSQIESRRDLRFKNKPECFSKCSRGRRIRGQVFQCKIRALRWSVYAIATRVKRQRILPFEGVLSCLHTGSKKQLVRSKAVVDTHSQPSEHDGDDTLGTGLACNLIGGMIVSRCLPPGTRSHNSVKVIRR